MSNKRSPVVGWTPTQLTPRSNSASSNTCICMFLLDGRKREYQENTHTGIKPRAFWWWCWHINQSNEEEESLDEIPLDTGHTSFHLFMTLSFPVSQKTTMISICKSSGSPWISMQHLSTPHAASPSLSRSPRSADVSCFFPACMLIFCNNF